MMPHSIWCRVRLLSSYLLVLLFVAGCGQGDGQPKVEGTVQPALIGVLVDAPISGVTYQTSSGDSGTTDANGTFEYSQLESITFSIGDVELGTVPGAPVITSVELMGANDATDQSVVNQLVFLQSIDADGDPSNGIEISAAAASRATGMSLDFSAADFADQIADMVETIAGTDAVVVSETDALYHFYQTYVEFGGSDTFDFDFPGFAPAGGGVVYNLAFADDFEIGDAPNPDNWSYETGYGPDNSGWGNNEWQLYTNSPENVRLEEGNLVIQARCDTPPCGSRDGSITSSRITTQNKFNFKFGRVIARIKPPVGDGAWPAFWALGSNFPVVGWPRTGEIDFMEMHYANSNDRTTHSAMHWCDQTVQSPETCSFPDGWRFNTQQRTFPSSLGDDFHIWEAEWDENEVTVWLDGQQYFNLAIDPNTMEEFLEEFFMILNVAMGGTLGSNSQPPNGTEVFPQTMLVDYVRVFQRTGGTSSQGLTLDFEEDPESYDFGPSGGFGGGAAAVVENPVPEGINTSAQVGRMLKFEGEVFAGSLLTLPDPISVPTGSSFTMKVWSPRPVMVLLKLEGPTESERNVAHTGSGWEELTFDFGGYSGIVEAFTFIFDLGVVGDATNDPDNWTFYFDDITFVPSDGGDTGGGGDSDFPLDFEEAAANYDFGVDGGFGGGASAVIDNPEQNGINTSNQVARMLKFSGEVFAGSKLFLQNPLEVPGGSMFTIKVWSPRPVMVLFKIEGAAEAEVNVPHTGSGWEELTFNFGGHTDTVDGLVFIFDLGVVGDATNDPDNWTFYYDDITFIPPDGGDSGGGDLESFGGGFEAAPALYNFGVDGGFGGGVASVVLNPVSDADNQSAQVVRMQKFEGEVFAGTKLFLPEAEMVEPGSVFTMNVWSPRPVMVLFKLEGDNEAEINVPHGGSGWETLSFDFGSFSGNIDGIVLIFDLGITGDAGGDPDNWTFYFDDIQLSDGTIGGPGDLNQIDLPITFDDPTVDYTVVDFGLPVAAMTSLVADPQAANNTVASTIKPLGAPVWAGTTISTEAGLASAIPFTIDRTTIGIRVFSAQAGIPVRLKAENEVGGSVSVETETSTTVTNEWETLVFDFANEVEGDPLDVNADYAVLSVFFNFGTDGNTAGQQTYLWDDVEFGVEPVIVDTTAPIVSSASIESDNADTALAKIGDIVTLTIVTDEAISTPLVTIAGLAAEVVTGSDTQWQASRELTATDADGVITFAANFEDLAGNAGVVQSSTTDGSLVTLDGTVPTVVVTGIPDGFTSLAPISVSVQFSEAVVGFDLSDLVVVNAATADFTPEDATSYSVDLIPDGNGDVSLSIAMGAAMDPAGNASDAATPAISLIDAQAPSLTSVTLSSSNAEPQLAMIGDTVFLAFTSDESLMLPAVTINGVPADSVTGADAQWQASRVLLADDPEGVIEFSIAFSDQVGNSGVPVSMTSNSSSVMLDVNAPTVTISNAPNQIVDLDPFEVTITFSEEVSGFDASDLVLVEASVTDFVQIDDLTYTALIDPSNGIMDVSISVAPGAAQDAAGNVNSASNIVVVTGDAIFPTVSLSLASSNPATNLAKIGDLVTLTIGADETLATPFVTIGGLAAEVSGSGQDWQATRVISGDEPEGPLAFSAEAGDLVGNFLIYDETTDSSIVSIDTVAPTAMIDGAPSEFTSLAPIDLTIQFDGAVVDFDASDIQTSNGAVTDFAAVDLATFNIAVTPTGIGDLIVTLAEGAASDEAGNLSIAIDDVVITNMLDEDAPLLTVVTIASDNTNDQYATSGDVVTLSFSADEEIQTPDVMIAGVAADSVTGSGADWMATRMMQGSDAEGVVSFVIDIQDLGSNDGQQSTISTDGSTVSFDVTAPLGSISVALDTVTTLDPIAVTVDFGEAVNGFALSDLEVTNATANDLVNVDNASYIINVTPDGAGDITLSLAAGVAQDLAGIDSLAAEDVVITLDTAAPTLSNVSIVSSNVNDAYAAIGDVVTISFSASEAIATPTVLIAGIAADSVMPDGGFDWQASRTLAESDAEGQVALVIDFEDAGGNPGVQVDATTDGSSVTFDRTAPTVEILNAPTTVNSQSLFTVDVVFSEAVIGFGAADMTLSNANVSSVIVNDEANYSVGITPDGNGDVVIALGADVATDLAGNANAAAVDMTVLFDAEAPILNEVSIASDNATDTLYAQTGDTVTVTFTASEDIETPVVVIAGVAADAVVDGPTEWQATRVMQAGDTEGSVSFTIDFVDLNGNDGIQVDATTDTSDVTFDITAPIVTIGGLPLSFTSIDPISLTIEFDEDVTGFESNDIAVEGGTAADFAQVSPSSYTIEITPDGTGDVVVSIASDAAIDAAGNGSVETSETSESDLPPAWALIWSDDFDGVALDDTKWNIRTDADCAAPCTGQQGYTEGNISVSGGVLSITAQEIGSVYTSGLIDSQTKLDFTYGRIEIDARMPAGAGGSPTLWMLPTTDAYGVWPLSGELDIASAQNLGVAGNTMTNHDLHYGLLEPENTVTGIEFAPTSPTTAFVTYAVEWEAGEIRWFVDGTHIATQTQSNWYTYTEGDNGVYEVAADAAPFDQDFYLVLSLTSNSTAQAGFSQSLDIDAVRVYECANATDPDAGTGCSTGIGIAPIDAPAGPFTQMLDIYTDAPGVLMFNTDEGVFTNNLEPGSIDNPLGTVLTTSNIAASDGGNTIWNVAAAALNAGDFADVFMSSEDLSADPVLDSGVDVTGAEAAGELIFDLRVNSATVGTVLTARIESGTGNAGEVAIEMPANADWNTYSVKVADLLNNQSGSGLDLTRVLNLFVIQISNGTADIDLDNIRLKVACRDTDTCIPAPRIKEIEYSQDFEGLDQMNPDALGSSGDGWLVFGNVFQSDGTTIIYGYGPFSAPNGTPGFSAIDSGQGGPEQGLQQLSIYNDYNNTDHNTDRRIEANVFQERVITADDIGKTLWFSFDAKRGNINDPTDASCTGSTNPPCDSTALAFIKTLDPSSGFITTNFVNVDTTNLPTTWARYSLSLVIDAALEDQLLQYGFTNVAGNYEASGVLYDNLVVTKADTVP